MRCLLLAATLLASAAPAVMAQTAEPVGVTAGSRQVGPGEFHIFFEFDESELTPQAQRVVAEAAAEYRRGGSAQITLIGYADKVGTVPYNQALSARRARSVERELVRLGVPGGSIATRADGETNPPIPTADGVREPGNRRVEIRMPQPAVAAAPAPAPMAEPAQPARETMTRTAERRDRFVVGVAPMYGHNFRETDKGAESDLAGAEFTFSALPGMFGGLSFKQGVFWSFNAVDEGIAGRSVLSADLAPDLGLFRPRFSVNFGGVYGEGVQDGLVAGPEIGLDVNLPGGFTLRPKVAYDYQFRNPWDDWDDWDNGILWVGVDLGFRF